MKKSTKGAIAAVGAAALLLGGAGSLAFWTATASVGGGTITAGSLKLVGAEACASAPWKLDTVGTPAGTTFDPSGQRVVPGDVLTKTCDFTVVAVGTHLAADVGLSTPAATSTGAIVVNAVGSFTDAVGAPVTQITEANDGDPFTAKLTLTVDGPSNGNDTMDNVISLDGYTVTLTQAH